MKNNTNTPAELSLFTFPDVFSDIFNGLLFKGKEVIIPDDLVPVNDNYLQGLRMSRPYAKPSFQSSGAKPICSCPSSA